MEKQSLPCISCGTINVQRLFGRQFGRCAYFMAHQFNFSKKCKRVQKDICTIVIPLLRAMCVMAETTEKNTNAYPLED